jgi:hypothetical protein
VADTSPGSPGSSSSGFGFLGRKIGPVPIWLIALVLLGIWYWYENYGPGATSSSSADTAPESDYASTGGGGTGRPEVFITFKRGGAKKPARKKKDQGVTRLRNNGPKGSTVPVVHDTGPQTGGDTSGQDESHMAGQGAPRPPAGSGGSTSGPAIADGRRQADAATHAGETRWRTAA